MTGWALIQKEDTAGGEGFGWATTVGKRVTSKRSTSWGTKVEMCIFNNGDIIDLQSYRIGEKKTILRAIMPFKVIQGHQGRYQSKACMRLPLSDWY